MPTQPKFDSQPRRSNQDHHGPFYRSAELVCPLPLPQIPQAQINTAVQQPVVCHANIVQEEIVVRPKGVGNHDSEVCALQSGR